MFDQFFIIHTSGLSLFQLSAAKDQAFIDNIITQFVIENRVQQDPLLSQSHKYFVNFVRELQILIIASLPRTINIQNPNELLAGMVLCFITKFEDLIKKCPLEFKISDFEPFKDMYLPNLNSLIKNGTLQESTSDVQETQPIDSTIDQEQLITESQLPLDPEEAKRKIELIKQQMREKSLLDRKQKSQQNMKKVSPKTSRTISPTKASQKELDESEINKYSFVETSQPTTQELLVEKTSQITQNVQNSTFSLFQQKSLTPETINEFLSQFRSQLLSQNLSSITTDQILNSVRQSLLSAKKSTFQSAKSLIAQEIKTQLSKSIKLRPNFIFNEIANNKSGKPYVIAIIGINGMGKTTTIGKLLFKLKQANLKGFVCACDSFRSGAVEQVKTHCTKLGMSCYDQGYGKNPSAIAKYGINQAIQESADVVLIDTAGRMHNNSGLMQELCKLISDNQPDLILYVGEALVGSTGAVQIREYSSQIKEACGRNIDGVILTKYDAIGDKVGAALNFTYESGLPIVYVGVGQAYPDLVEIEVDEIVRQIM